MSASFLLWCLPGGRRGACEYCLCCQTLSDCSQRLSYHLDMQAKIVKSIAAEEEWLRLLVHELAPVIEHLHADELPLSKPPVIYSLAQGALL